MRNLLFVALILVTGLASPLQAGIFGKKPKVPPEKRVPELLAIIKTDGDENKRFEAVEELRQFDPKLFPEIVPTLLDVLMNDKKPSVRSEAAQTLSKLRPVTPQIGEALETARDKDPSLRVRMQARSSLLSYHWAGWWSDPGKLKPEATAPTSKEPPLAPPVVTTPPTAKPTPPIFPTSRTKPAPEPMNTQPLAPVISTPPPPVIRTTPGGLAPLPKGPEVAPVPPVKSEGPELGPQE